MSARPDQNNGGANINNNNNNSGIMMGNGENPARNSDDKNNELLQKTQAVRSFLKLFSAKLESASKSGAIKAAYSGSEREDYLHEVGLLRQATMASTVYGLGAGVASFVFLRRFPSTLAKTIRGARRRHNDAGWPGSSSSINNPFHKGNVTPPSNSSSSGDAIPNWRPVGGIGGLFGLLFDLSLSALTGFGVAFSMIDRQKILTSLTDVPLQAGRSVICDEICPDSIALYRSYPLALWASGTQRETPEQFPHNALVTIQTFVQNCHLRRSYEDEIRHDRGDLAPHQPVVIPASGVPFRDDALTTLLSDDHGGPPNSSRNSNNDDRYATDPVFHDENMFHTADQQQDDPVVDDWSSFEDFSTDHNGTTKR